MQKHVMLDGATVKNLPLNSIDAWRDSGILNLWGIDDSGEITARKGYSAVGWSYRCVNVRAAALSALPWSLFRGDDEIADQNNAEVDGLPWLESLPTMLYLTEAALCILSEAYWFKERNRGNRTTALRWLAPDTMSPSWGDDGISNFVRRVNTKTITIPPERIVYHRLPNPLHETEPGTSPLQAALNDVGVIFNLTQFASTFFKRGAVRTTLLTVEGTPPEAERQRLKSWWSRVVAGIGNAFGAEVVSAAVSPVVIGDGVDSLNNESLNMEKRESISTAMGVPHSLVMSNAANFATANADRLTFYDMTVIPQARIIQQVMNKQLFDDYGLRFQFRPEALSLYQQDENERAAAFEVYSRTGLPKSMIAEMLGMNLPPGWEYADLDDEPQTITVLPPQPAQLPEPEPTADEAKAADIVRFKRWAKRKSNPDPSRFESDHLDDAEKAAILGDMGDGVADDAPFPVATTWADYP